MAESDILQTVVWVAFAILITIIIAYIVFHWYSYNYVYRLLGPITPPIHCSETQLVPYREQVYIPTQNGVYELPLATALIDICANTSRSNCDNLLPIPNPPGFTNQYRIVGSDPISGSKLMFAYIFWNVDLGQACIAFTGTEFKSVYQSDFQYQQVPPVLLNGYESGVLVHSGFYNIYTSIRGKLWEWYNENHHWITRLYITGHSLGGALSTLCGYDFGGNPNNHPLMIHYSFGAPRSGNLEYANIFAQRVPASIRVNNTEDIVPQLPMAQIEHYTYEQTIGNMPFTVSLGSTQRNHSKAYLDYLPQCANTVPCHATS